MSRVINERVIVLLALLLAAAGLLASSFQTTFSDVGSAHSPVFFPRIILIMWIGLTVIALAEALIKAPGSTPIQGLWRLALLVIAAVAYTMYLNTYGFFICSALFAVLCLFVFGIRNPLIILAYAVAVPGALVALFNHLLRMPLPTSTFTHYF